MVEEAEGESTSGNGGMVPGTEAEDGLDSIEAKNFSATEYLNKLFPNEESLSSLDDFLVKLRWVGCARARHERGGGQRPTSREHGGPLLREATPSVLYTLTG